MVKKGYFSKGEITLWSISVLLSILSFVIFDKRITFALAYAANDVVLIVLWILATLYDRSYLGVMVCFITFLVNDLWGFYSWLGMKKRQQDGK